MFLIIPAYARGHDLKLARHLNDSAFIRGGLQLSSMNQMLGYGCRSLGVACGGYFTFSYDRGVYLEEMLLSLQLVYKEGAKVLELLVHRIRRS